MSGAYEGACSDGSISGNPLPLEGGAGGIARTSGHTEMRNIKLSAFCEGG